LALSRIFNLLDSHLWTSILFFWPFPFFHQLHLLFFSSFNPLTPSDDFTHYFFPILLPVTILFQAFPFNIFSKSFFGFLKILFSEPVRCRDVWSLLSLSDRRQLFCFFFFLDQMVTVDYFVAVS